MKERVWVRKRGGYVCKCWKRVSVCVNVSVWKRERVWVRERERERERERVCVSVYEREREWVWERVAINFILFSSCQRQTKRRKEGRGIFNGVNPIQSLSHKISNSFENNVHQSCWHRYSVLTGLGIELFSGRRWTTGKVEEWFNKKVLF